MENTGKKRPSLSETRPDVTYSISVVYAVLAHVKSKSFPKVDMT